MSKFHIISVLSVFCLAATLVDAKGACEKIHGKGIDVDVEHLMKSMETGYYITLVKDLNFAKDFKYDVDIPEDHRKWKNKKCATLTTVSPQTGRIKVDVVLHYNSTKMFAATFKGRENKFGLKLNSYGDMSVVHMEAHHYLLAICIIGKEPAWAVLSPDSVISKGKRDNMLDFVKKLGFSREGVEPADSQKVKPYKIRAQHDCNNQKDDDDAV